MLALAAGSAGAHAAEPPAPIRVTSAELNSLTFARLVIRLPGDDGIFLGADEHRVRFLETLRSVGYPALGAESLVFGRDEADAARFALGGTVKELDCDPANSAVRRCKIGVVWELLDRSEDRVAYRVTTRYQVRGGNPRELGTKLLSGVFASLLARPRFIAALKKKPGDASATGSAYAAAMLRSCPPTAL